MDRKYLTNLRCRSASRFTQAVVFSSKMLNVESTIEIHWFEWILVNQIHWIHWNRMGRCHGNNADNSPISMTLVNSNLTFDLIPPNICLYGVCSPDLGVVWIEECYGNRSIVLKASGSSRRKANMDALNHKVSLSLPWGTPQNKRKIAILFLQNSISSGDV